MFSVIFIRTEQTPLLSQEATEGLKNLFYISVSIAVSLLVAVILWLLFSGLEAQSMLYFYINITTNCIQQTVKSARIFYFNFSPNPWQMHSGRFIAWHYPLSPHHSLTWLLASRGPKGKVKLPSLPHTQGSPGFTLSPCPAPRTPVSPQDCQLLPWCWQSTAPSSPALRGPTELG